MKRIGLLLFSFLVFISPCFAQTKQDSGVKFSSLSGDVRVRPNVADDDDYRLARLDMTLYNDDRIRTIEKSGAILSFADLSTFVMKEDSIIVLDVGNEKNSKINLIAGNIWVNVKKMVADGSMDVEMSQAVAGIKGTNITCSTSRDEDRIQVLRGYAEVLIRESREKIMVNEGEELVVKAGGKTEKVEIDVTQEQKKWEDATSKMGESIQLNEVPEILKGILDLETSEFARINEGFNKLLALNTVEEADAREIKKSAERFIGVILEDSLILSSIRRKIEAGLATPDISASERVRLAGLLKEVAAVSAKQQSYQAQIARIMRYQFKLSAVVEEISAELEMLRTELAQAVSEVDAIKAVLSGNPSGMSQDWFKDAMASCNQALNNLAAMQLKAAELLARNPSDKTAMAMVKSIADQQNSIAAMMRSLTVVEISSSQTTEMQQTDDVLSDQMAVLQAEISSYNNLSGTTTAEKERRLTSSIQIMSSFARARRLYVNAQRQYDSIMRSTAVSKFKTSEQEEIESLWQNISDRFQQLGIVATELESNIKDLESQLSSFLK